MWNLDRHQGFYLVYMPRRFGLASGELQKMQSCGQNKRRELNAPPLEAPRSAFGKKHAEPRPMGACSRRLFPVVKIRGFLVEQADATQNINCYIMRTDAAMIGRAGFMPSAKGIADA